VDPIRCVHTHCAIIFSYVNNHERNVVNFVRYHFFVAVFVVPEPSVVINVLITISPQRNHTGKFIIKITTEQNSDRKINNQQDKIDKLELVSIFQKSDYLLKIVGIDYNTTYAMLNIDESHKKTMKMRRTIFCTSSKSSTRTKMEQFRASSVRRPSCSRFKFIWYQNLKKLMRRQPRYMLRIR
jgi:hypothetical protein